jgi:hypothetical protein
MKLKKSLFYIFLSTQNWIDSKYLKKISPYPMPN